jgi:hypothetical protein
MSTSTYVETSNSAPASAPRPRRPNVWLIVGAILTALVLIAGSLTVANWLGYRTETEQQTYQADGTDISLDIDMGDVIIRPGRPGVVTVTRQTSWSFQRPRIDERWDGRTLRITGSCPARPWAVLPCGATYTIEVPAEATVRARVSAGDITVDDVRGGLDLTASLGDIQVTGAGGELRLHSSHGDVIASAITADTVEASTVTGDVRLTLSAPPRTVSAQTTAGDVHVVVPRGETYRVEADAGVGDMAITVDQDVTSDRSIVARTSAGDIDVRHG